MPIYEYKCNGCNRVVSIFFRSFSVANGGKCPECGSEDLQRLVSKVAILKTEAERLADLSEATRKGSIDPGDHRTIDHWARQMSEQMGEEVGGQMKGMLDRLEGGEAPPELADPQYFAQSLINRKAAGIDVSSTGSDDSQ